MQTLLKANTINTKKTREAFIIIVIRRSIDNASVKAILDKTINTFQENEIVM